MNAGFYNPSPYARTWSESKTLPLPQELQPKYISPINGKKLLAGALAVGALTLAICYGAMQREPQHVKDARAVASDLEKELR